MNTTGQSFNLYTNVDATEFDAFGGIYRPLDGKGVQDQIGAVLKTQKVRVVPPVMKR